MFRIKSKTQNTLKTFTVEVERKGIGNLPATVRNISPEGMHLELESTLQQPGKEIRLVCLVNDKKWLILATVINANSTGLGVMFNRPQPGLMRAATTFLSKQVQPIAGRFAFT